MSVLEFRNVSRIYAGPPLVDALKNISLTIAEGAFVAITGPSGSGKSTLLNLASGLDRQSSGDILVAGKNLKEMSQTELCDFRSHHVGFIFQAYNLFPVLTVLENTEFTSILRGDKPKEVRARALEALSVVGLLERANNLPNQLSGGQQQRVAVARALATNPKIVFADEPTANLDSKTGGDLIDLFKTMNRKMGVTFIFSTHDHALISKVDTQFEMHDGALK